MSQVLLQNVISFTANPYVPFPGRHKLEQELRTAQTSSVDSESSSSTSESAADRLAPA
jgi:hypothetical protein